MSKKMPMLKIVLIVIGACAVIALVLPSYFRARYVDCNMRCIINLRYIMESKRRWAQDYNKTKSDTPTWNDLYPYMPDQVLTNGVFIHPCHKGGTYRIGRIDEPPTCSIGGSGHSVKLYY